MFSFALSRRQWLSGVTFLAVLGSLAGTVVAPQARATPPSIPVDGYMTHVLFSGPGCPSPVGFCSQDTVTGKIMGSGIGVIQTVSQANPNSPGVVFITADGVLHTNKGDIDFALSVARNSNSAVNEFSNLMEITGGTGNYAGVTGYLLNAGSSAQGVTPPPQSPYTGTLIFP